MKKLVVYYSFEGNTKLIAETIAQAIEADILELRLKKELKSRGFIKYLWGGRQVTLSIKPELQPLDKNPEKYDVLFIGTPVWAWTYTPALRTFFSAHLLSNKKIALFCCHGGGKGWVFDKMKKALKLFSVLGESDYFEPLKTNPDMHIQKAAVWSKKIMELVSEIKQ